MLGFVIGICALCKQNFLPFIFFVPLFLSILKPKRIERRYIVCAIVTALIVILPWTIRNWTLTKTIIPVHARGGSVLFFGDLVVENYTKSPFSVIDLHQRANKVRTYIKQTIPKHLNLSQKEIMLDKKLFEQSIDRYRKNPIFIVKKLFFNALMFWTLGQSFQKSAVISLMQIPLLMLFIFTTVKIIKQNKILAISGGTILFVWLYFILHLPFLAQARYGVVLIPTMLASLGVLVPKLHDQ
jgi:4-amino-4-deoxy-L-arabinose transferase-like glycosyltransferase